ncbi:MAG: YjfB family protein [Muribaculaceae bacterium]|nr:YjfB family protein [Muribaculaceae bacterium]
MNITGLPMSVSVPQTVNSFSVAMLSKSLDAVSSTGAQMVDMMNASAMERSVNPAVGSNFDAYI